MTDLKHAIRDHMPAPLLAGFRHARAAVRRRQFRGTRYYCNICDSSLRQWLLAGRPEHRNRVCPVCNAYGRHRVMAIVLTTELFSSPDVAGTTLLHFAPELGLQRWIRRRPRQLRYLSADLDSPGVDVTLDVQQMNLADGGVDVILLSHVLEHVDDDRKALREIHRVLSPGGRLFLQVPLSGDPHTLDEKLATSSERLERYGKTDHVRLYGDDIQSRLSDAGFRVTVYRATDERFAEQFERMALDIPGESAMLYDNESTTFVARKCPA